MICYSYNFIGITNFFDRIRRRGEWEKAFGGIISWVIVVTKIRVSELMVAPASS